VPAFPLLSVIIPTFHRNDALALCLTRLAPGAQTLDPGSYEVIVSDAGTRSTAEMTLRQQFPWARWSPAPGCGPGVNRNLGARQARGDWVVFVDDDCLPEPGWLQAIADSAQTNSVDVIEGKTAVPDERDNPLYYAPYNPTGGLLWSCNLAVRRKVFEQMGGFDEDLIEQCEDMEFAHRVVQARLRTLFRPDALVWHPMRRHGWRGIIRQTLKTRWHLLYALKTRTSAPPGANAVFALARLAATQFLNLLRTTWHLLSRHDAAHWKSKWFWQIWSWLTFPLLLPYLMIWEMRFRSRLFPKKVPENNRPGSARN
jgi:GT2 family glycosyltransferase